MIEIAVASNDPYVPWAATLMRSILDEHPPQTVRFHLLSLEPLQGRRALHEMVTEGQGVLEEHVVDRERVASLPRVGQYGSTVWLRLLLPELLPDHDRVLYLDADTLVVQHLGQLWETPLGDAPVAAVANVVAPSLHGYIAELGIADPIDFFNSGVLLMDLDRWRAEGATSDLVAAAMRRGQQLIWADQDILNEVFAGRWLELHPRWNAQNSLWTWADLATRVFGAEKVREATTDPAIVHFEGPTLCKPWHYLADHPWRDTYRHTLGRTPWAETPLEGRSLANRAIRVLPPKWRVSAFLWWGRARGGG